MPGATIGPRTASFSELLFPTVWCPRRSSPRMAPKEMATRPCPSSFFPFSNGRVLGPWGREELTAGRHYGFHSHILQTIGLAERGGNALSEEVLTAR